MARVTLILTQEQTDAVRNDDAHTLLTACPGSGKTRVVVAKLLRCITEVRATARRIACITFTNAAVYEIESRLRQYGRVGDDDYYTVATIHSFCLNEIFRYFCWRTREYASGFMVAPPDSDIFTQSAKDSCRKHGIDYAKVSEHFELLNRQPNGDPVVPSESPLSSAAVLDFWRTLGREGYLDFANIVYFSFELLRFHPSIRRALASKFAWILVDEFQDTSALQVEILKLIAGQELTRFFLVGDPYQSIFGFAGARPDLADRFGEHIGADTRFVLTGNYRCSEGIIQDAQRLCPRTPRMYASGRNATYTATPEYHHSTTTFNAITDYFLPALEQHEIPFGKAAILAPWWIKLLHLGRALREYGVPVIGPGARPYKRTHLFALLAENVCAYVEQPTADLIPAVEKELYNLVLQVCGKPNPLIYTYAGRACVFRLLHEARRLRAAGGGAIEWLQTASRLFAEMLCTDGYLPSSAGSLLTQSAEDMRADMVRNGVDVANLQVADLGLYGSRDRSLKLLTMHKAKGREFDAVAIVDVHDGRIPHYSARTEEEIAEGRRLLYVAITRAQSILMYITDQEDRRNLPSRFLGAEGLGVA